MKVDPRIRDLLGIDLPILQAPMAGVSDEEMAIAVSEAGGLGSLPCGMLSPEQVRSAVERIRSRTAHPFNLNFFCHVAPERDPERETAWLARLAPYYSELGIGSKASASAATPPTGNRAPFNDAMCEPLMEVKPRVVSFHYGLPSEPLLKRVKSIGTVVLSSATTVEEARWLEERGCDAIIAQGLEAGGHRGMFLAKDPASQVGTLALVPQVVDAVKVPVIASGGIADARGIVASLALGASAVQIGTAYLRCRESKISAVHRQALQSMREDQTVITNVLTGRPARGFRNRLIEELGPISDLTPPFPLASNAVAPLRAKAEAEGSGAFSPLWAGQGAPLAQRKLSAGDLTRSLANEVLGVMEKLCRENVC